MEIYRFILFFKFLFIYLNKRLSAEINTIKILFCFPQAEENILKNKLDKEYSPIGGSAEFCKLSNALALCEKPGDACGPEVVTVQVRLVNFNATTFV